MSELNEFRSNQSEEVRSKVSPYSGSELTYFKRVYGSDRWEQLHDGHQEDAILRYCKPEKVKEVKHMLNQLYNLSCSNEPGIPQPGRSAISLNQLKENLQLYMRPAWRSLNWNKHFNRAIEIVAKEVKDVVCRHGILKPESFQSVSTSGTLLHNKDKNAGFIAFETGKRSKAENMEDALKWCYSNKERIATEKHYKLPLVMSHRSSNSKPVVVRQDDGSEVLDGWKWKCRIILMEDLRALLFDGRFCIPLIKGFEAIPWGEGSMNQTQVRDWVGYHRARYDSYYSSDYSKFDVSEEEWCLLKIFYNIIRPCFGKLSKEDQDLFDAMVNSYIYKEIHGFDGIYRAKRANISGSLITYLINTIYNRVVDTTSWLMQGCDPSQRRSLLCGDDNLTYYNSNSGFSIEKHCKLIYKYFGISTTIGKYDCGSSSQDPVFLSKTWTKAGERRSLYEVLWNLVFPERFRDYNPSSTGVATKRAEALIFYCACLEQLRTMQEWFDVRAVQQDAFAKGDRMTLENTYRILASMGTGFNDPWIHWRQSLRPSKLMG